MPGLELFHRLSEPDSAAARRLLRELGLLDVGLVYEREGYGVLGGRRPGPAPRR